MRYADTLAMLAAIPAEFQYRESVLGMCKRSSVKLTRAGIQRLVDLGLVEQQPSDGFGPSIRVKVQQ